jgi:hypothetical protein
MKALARWWWRFRLGLHAYGWKANAKAMERHEPGSAQWLFLDRKSRQHRRALARMRGRKVGP